MADDEEYVDTSFKDAVSKCSRCCAVAVMKWLLVAITFLLAASGVAIIIGAMWLMFDPSLEKEVQKKEELQGLRSGAWVLLVPGLILTIINSFGCSGAFYQKPKFLVAFFVLVLLTSILEVIVISWSLSNRHHVVELIDNVVERNIQSFIKENDTHARDFMVNIQVTMHCCGFTGIKDYMNEDQRSTCYTQSSSEPYTEGCRFSLSKVFANNIIIIGIVEFVHLVIMILAMAGTMILRKEIVGKRKRSRTYSRTRAEEDDNQETVQMVESHKLKFV